jgi:dihydrolipoamide dehydrogenase
MTDKYDVVVIGAGTAGLTAVREIAKQTENFLLVNDGPYGTTCARVGCMPSKVLIETANVFHRRRIFDEFGVRGGVNLEIDVPAVLARVRRLRDGFVSGTLETTRKLGNRSIPGRAMFVAPDKLAINGKIIQAKRIVIATGSRPVLPDAWRGLGDRIITSDSLYEMPDLPPALAVVGLGTVGVEMAQAPVKDRYLHYRIRHDRTSGWANRSGG